MAEIAVTALNPSAGDTVVDMLLNVGLQWAKDGWGGYVVPGVVPPLNFFGAIMITPKLTYNEAVASVQPAIDFANSIGNLSVKLDTKITTLEGSYWEFYNSDAAQLLASVGVGTSSAYASRLIPKSLVEEKTTLAKTFKQMNKAGTPFGLLLVTPSAYDLPESDRPGGPGEASVTPAWREALWHVITQSTWQADDATYGGKGSAKALYQSVTANADPLRQITPGGGSYQNEGDTFEPNYEQSFWGSNYDRLLKIKQSIDPDNILTCHNCVGYKADADRFQCFPRLQ